MATVEIHGDEEVIAELKAFPQYLKPAMKGAGEEAAETILDSPGLRKYPGETAANKPPVPYYIRGVGTQYARRNLGNSEKYGASFAVETSGYYETAVGNTASYAKYLGGDEQAEAMERIGWKKLYDVANGMRARLGKIYAAWVDDAKKLAGL